MRFLHAKTAPVFRFFVGLTIIAFAFFTIVPKPLLAQEAATTTEEMATTEETVNDERLTINDCASTATTTEETVNDERLTINDCASTATTTEETVNDERLTINDCASTATSTEEIINDQSEDELNDQLSIINNDSSATTTDSLIEIEFTNVYYGQVGEGQAAIAPQITSAIVRNVSQTPAAVMLWQDDMGLGRGQDGEWNIQYGARAAGGEWIFYDPFQMVVLPDVLPAGESAAMEFSVRVIDFPKDEVGANTDYTGIMTINGVAAPQGEQSLPFLNEILSGDVADSDLKPESEIE
ncbi:MAG: hypothetical protein YFSK_3190 [Candidatus Yanofskyibacterium parasiticum]|nr:MAG: hypothetical protein YFSK_3190 [Candidatus Yanofskybacteria bacterium]